MKFIFVILLAGCAAVKLPYTSEHEVFQTTWGISTTKTVTVHNPFKYDIIANVVCRHDLFEEESGHSVRVSARNQKQILVNVSSAVWGEMCHIANFDFIGEE